MFLTRMALDIRREETAMLLQNPGDMRRQLAKVLVSGHQRMLWRLDELGSRTWLVMLSRQRPDLLELHERYGYPGVFPSWETFSIDDELDEMWPGTTWYFELTASPTGVTDRKDDAWLVPERLTEWLSKQGTCCGYQLEAIHMVTANWSTVEDKYMLMAAFTGRLTVTDEDMLVWTLTNGVGGGRDYGAGLMTLSRTKSFWE